ncbi:EAL domain-containing protein [Marinibaculum pumilum]|uniref:EAL domain-containing protein n=1 Tax=Marinibaculum pumilum TaxID=1766165 RepID=A0ABV7KX15_9PROT
MADKLAVLQAQRDRFLAFSFAAADLLLEVDSVDGIAYASGATMKLLGREATDLQGGSFLDTVAPTDRALVKAAVRDMGPGKRLPTLNVQLAHGNGALRAWVNGYRMPMADGRAYIAMSTAERFRQRVPQDGARDGQSGLLDGEALTQALARAVESGATENGREMLTLLEVEGLDGLGQRLAPAAFQNLMSEIGGFLRLQSGGRDLAGRLGESRFGVVHEGGDGRSIEARIAQMTRDADPDGNGLSVVATDMAMDAPALTPAEAARAVIHTLKQFEKLGAKGVPNGDLASAFHDLLNGTIAKLADFKQILSQNAIDLVYQPIVGLNDGQLHHYELLARFRDGRKTFEYINFGESMGMNAQLDLLVTRRAIEDLTTDFDGTKLSLAVNLSGNSLQDAGFTQTLLELLRDHGKLSGHLLFEVTESAEINDLAGVNEVLQDIRAMGFEVCLDDFGAGAASFQYLQALNVDFVKIDGAYVHRLADSARDRHMLAAITAMCADLKVGVIAEMVETEEQVRLLRELGATHAQGYLFGKPAAEPAGVERRTAGRVGRRSGARELWA